MPIETGAATGAVNGGCVVVCAAAPAAEKHNSANAQTVLVSVVMVRLPHT
jgi:hypothetical protein